MNIDTRVVMEATPTSDYYFNAMEYGLLTWENTWGPS